MDLSHSLAGLVVGVIVGVTGVGGGALMTPLLILLFGVAPVVAVGTDLLYAAITKLGGIGVHARHRTIRWDIAARLWAGSLPGALLALTLLGGLQHSPHYRGLITTVLGVALILTAVVMLARERLQRWGAGGAGALHDWTERHRGALTVAAGAVIGVLVTLSSVGAGALGAATLFLLYPRLPARGVVGTDLAHAVPLALVAGFGHLRLGSVDPALLGALLLGSLPGIVLGAHLGLRLPEHWLRRALGGLLLALGLKFAF